MGIIRKKNQVKIPKLNKTLAQFIFSYYYCNGFS